MGIHSIQPWCNTQLKFNQNILAYVKLAYCSESMVTTFNYKFKLYYLVTYDWPSDPVTRRKSDPFDSDMLIDVTRFQHWYGLLFLYYTSNRQQHSIELLCRSQLTCTTATQQGSHVNIHQHSCQNIHDIVTTNDNDFCLHFNDNLLHKK